MEIASLIAAEPDEKDTESGVTLSEINSIGNPNAFTVEEGVAFANPDATAAKPIFKAEDKHWTKAGAKSYQKASLIQ